MATTLVTARSGGNVLSEQIPAKRVSERWNGFDAGDPAGDLSHAVWLLESNAIGAISAMEPEAKSNIGIETEVLLRL